MPDLNLRWIPSFVYDNVELDLSYPVTRWLPGARTTGSVQKTVAGFPGPVLRLRKYPLSFTLRFTETEWSSVRSLIVFAQTSQSFLWIPHDIETGEIATSIEVFLDSPKIADGIRPARDGSLIWLMTLPISLVRADNLAWNMNYFTTPITNGAFDSAGFDSGAFFTGA